MTIIQNLTAHDAIKLAGGVARDYSRIMIEPERDSAEIGISENACNKSLHRTQRRDGIADAFAGAGRIVPSYDQVLTLRREGRQIAVIARIRR